MRLKRPKALKPGDTVGVVAPAGPVDEDALKAGLVALHRLGFEAKIFPIGQSKRHYLAGNDVYRVDGLTRAFADPDTRAVWCLRGGYGSVRTAAQLDIPSIDKHPKIFIGFSDITALLLHLSVSVPMVTFHGPVITQLPRLDDQSREHLVDVLTGRAKSIPLGSQIKVLKEGDATGALAGGNLSVLCSLVGTRVLPHLAGSLLFIEDVGEPAYRIDRMMMQLHLSGALTGVRGLLIGEFMGVPERDSESLSDLWEEVASWIQGPVIQGLLCGHGTTNVTLPVGTQARIDTTNDHVELLEPFLAPG